MNDVKQQINDIIIAIKSKNDPLFKDAELIDELDLNSLQVFELVMTLEEVFKIEFDLDKFDSSHFRSITNLVQHVKSFL